MVKVLRNLGLEHLTICTLLIQSTGSAKLLPEQMAMVLRKKILP